MDNPLFNSPPSSPSSADPFADLLHRGGSQGPPPPPAALAISAAQAQMVPVILDDDSSNYTEWHRQFFSNVGVAASGASHGANTGAPSVPQWQAGFTPTQFRSAMVSGDLDRGGGGAQGAAHGAAAAASTPAKNLCINGDDAPSSQAPSKKKKRGSQPVELGKVTVKVYEKVKSKERTTRKEVEAELVAEFSDETQKNTILKRVYDALNVMKAAKLYLKTTKSYGGRMFLKLTKDVTEKGSALCLQELKDRYVGMQNLIRRNEQSYGSGNTPVGAVALPLIVLQTEPDAAVNIEISEDNQSMHFDFNSTPFEYHDHSYVLKEMRLCEREHNDNQ